MGVTYDDGEYNVEIQDVIFSQYESDPPQIVLSVRVLQQFFRDSNTYSPCEQQFNRTIYLRYGEKYKAILLAKLRGAGWKGNDFTFLRGQMLAKTCIGVNKHRVAEKGKWAGQEVESWDLWLPPKEGSLENNPDVPARLNQMFGDLLKDVPEEVGSSKYDGKPPPEDEIPF